MGVLPQALKIIFKMQRKKSNTKIHEGEKKKKLSNLFEGHNFLTSNSFSTIRPA
jgi:hypothetical protein